MEIVTANLIQLTFRAVERLYTGWLEPHVPGLSIELADRQAYAQHLALTLQGAMACTCERTLCAAQHTLAAWTTSGRTLESFVYRAVMGPVGLKTQSIAQGMLFPYLRREYSLQVGLVAYKQCAHTPCGKLYEGATCPYCHTPFYPQSTALLGVERLIVSGERGYLPLRYWRCGGSQAAHFYPPVFCHDRGRHGSRHDCCPWQLCPAGNPPHGQRLTTLWVRARFLRAGTETSITPHVLEAVAEGVRQAITQCRGWEHTILQLLGDNALAIAETLLLDTPEAVLAEVLKQTLATHPEAPTPQLLRYKLQHGLRPRVLQSIRQVCRQRGIDTPIERTPRRVA